MSLLRKRLKQNIIILLIGIFLWGIIINYLDNHPGEKAAIVPGLQMLSEKVVSMTFSIIGKSPELVHMKSSLLRNFDELAFLVENNIDCLDSSVIENIETNRREIQDISYENIANQRGLYYSRAVSLKDEIEKTCSKTIIFDN